MRLCGKSFWWNWLTECYLDRTNKCGTGIRQPCPTVSCHQGMLAVCIWCMWHTTNRLPVCLHHARPSTQPGKTGSNVCVSGMLLNMLCVFNVKHWKLQFVLQPNLFGKKLLFGCLYIWFLVHVIIWNCELGFSRKDFAEHAKLCQQLLEHYHGQWLDRRVYWAARDRAALERDLICINIDSFDKSKLYLPKFPFNRTPKRTVYENCTRLLDEIANVWK